VIALVCQFFIYFLVLSRLEGRIYQVASFAFHMLVLIATDRQFVRMLRGGYMTKDEIGVILVVLLLPGFQLSPLIIRFALLYDIQWRSGPWESDLNLPYFLEKDINNVILRACEVWLREFPLNAAYLVVEDHHDVLFENDFETLFSELVRVQTLGPLDDDKIYFCEQNQVIYNWRSLNATEYSYKVLVKFNLGMQKAAHITHGLFKDGVFIQGQCIQ